MPDPVVPATKDTQVAAMAIAYDIARRTSGDLLTHYLSADKAITMATEQSGSKINVNEIIQAIRPDQG